MILAADSSSLESMKLMKLSRLEEENNLLKKIKQ
jgi:hypothetical protein